MPKIETISCNRLLSVFHHLRFHGRTLLLYQRMVAAGVRETARTFPSVLSSCSASNTLSVAKQIHGRAIRLAAVANPFVSSALVSVYAKLSRVDLAVKAFFEMEEITTAACNSILDGFAGSYTEMMEFFSEIKSTGVKLDGVSLSYALGGCSRGELLLEGRQIHGFSIKLGFHPSDLFVSNALVDLYSQCEVLDDATAAIAGIADDEIISWNSIVALHSAANMIPSAINFFSKMMAVGKRPSIRSLVSLLNSCSQMKSLKLGRSIHGLAFKLGFVGSSPHVLSTLIHAYGRWELIEGSVSLWDEFSEGMNLECCNSMIASLVYSGLMEDAIKMFGEMPRRDLRPDCVTFSGILRAISSSSIASLVSVLQIHCSVVKVGLQGDVAVVCALINAYSRTGGDVKGVIGEVLKANLLCFTAAISAFGRAGEGRKAIDAMEEMMGRGILPDKVAFLCAMASCDHVGMVEEGGKMLRRMEELGLEFDRRHYCVMVSLLARAGMVDEAAEVAARSPLDVAAWSSVLRGSKEYGKVEVGRKAARKLVEINPWSSESHKQVVGFFAAVEDIEALAETKKVRLPEARKWVGSSLVEVKEKLFL